MKPSQTTRRALAGLPHVLVLGAGFGGLTAARALGKMPVRVTVVDRKNHHTFQPLLYQVATAGLSPGDIAVPIRRVLRGYKNIAVLLDEAVEFYPEKKCVRFRDLDLIYDYLIVATGARHSYFQHPEWERFAPGLKTVEDALEIRRRMLLTFEKAERQKLATGSHVPLNFVVVGAGPTGVELAGAIAEIAREVLVHDFRNIDPSEARVLLLENTPHVLNSYPQDLSHKAEEQLKKLGVEVRTGTMVTGVEMGKVHTSTEVIPSVLTLWAAGVKASHLGALLTDKVDRNGRVPVEKDCSLAGHRDVFVIGDLASVPDGQGGVLPGVAPLAMQMARSVAANIKRDLQGKPRKDFQYTDKGSMATIGRAAAVAYRGKMHMSGLLAWMAWLFIHILYLIGFRNRLIVVTQWAWAYVRFERAARLITGNIEPMEKEASSP